MTQFLILFSLLLFAALGAVFYVAWRWRRLGAKEPRVLLTGGGTGGHVNPAIAIAEGIKAREPETRFLYVGVKDKAETIIVRRAGYPLAFVSSEGFPGLRPSLALLRFLARLTLGVSQSILILCRFCPRWVIATGGYVSAPIIMATLLLRTLGIAPTKVFLHEQNSIPGQLNSFLGRWADRVLLTFPQGLTFFPQTGAVVGYPIRHSVVLKPREEALSHLPVEIPEERKVVFVFGGSQGARTINRAIVDALRFLMPYRDKLFIIHGMGLNKSREYNAEADTEARLRSRYTPEELKIIEEFYYRQDYFHNIADVYSVSDLIVCRSGAGSLNEISRLGKPSLLIPKANLPGDHQVMNARVMRHAGAAEMLFEDTVVEEGKVLEKVKGSELAERILRLLQDGDRLHEMARKSRQFFRRQANERILSELYDDRHYNNGTGFHSLPLRPLMSNQQLLNVLAAAYNASPENYDPLQVIEDEDDLTYYRHRAAGLLSHDAWQDRNLGVKLVGLTTYFDKIPTLLHMLADRTPASRIKRLFGADFHQVGFIRRNIVQALQVMNRFDAEIEKHLLMCFQDPYYEVRAKACRAAGHFSRYLAGKEPWLQALLQCLQDSSFEVVVEAAKALGEVGIDGRALEMLLALREDLRWKVRDAALVGIRRLMERRVIAPSPELLSELSTFVLTATDFRPHFSIKETYKTLDGYCREEKPWGEETESTFLPKSASRKR